MHMCMHVRVCVFLCVFVLEGVMERGSLNPTILEKIIFCFHTEVRVTIPTKLKHLVKAFQTILKSFTELYILMIIG